jgi:hypothetical protein
LIGIFSDTRLQKTAAKCGFYKKKSDFMPAMFFDMLMYCASETEPCSLEHLSSILSEFYGIKISKQSIDERFNINSIDFVKTILTEALEKQLSKVYDAHFLPEYARIRIKDSTRFNLPERLSEYYRGSGGCKGTSNAAISLQFDYDVENGKVYSLDVTRGSRNDQTDAMETVADVNSNDLIIRDLGYYSLSTLSKIAEAKAFFISRFGTKTKAYDAQTMKEISFKELYASMFKNQVTRIEKNIYAGKTNQMPLRMIIETVSNEVYQKRLKKINNYNRSHGYSTSDEYKAQ